MAIAKEVEYTLAPDKAIVPPSALRRISWGAVLAGVVIAIIIQVMMNMLGLAVGAGAVDPTAPQPAIGPALGTGLVIWLVSSTLLGIFAGGYVAAHLAGSPNQIDGMLHGLLTWAVGTVIVFLLLSSTAGSVFNGIASALGQGMSLIGASVAEVAPEVADALNLQETAFTTIQEEVNALPTEEGTSIGVDLPIAVLELLRQDAETEGASETRDTVIQLLTEQTELTEQEAQAQIEEWEAEAEIFTARLNVAAEQAADDLADAIAATAGVLFAILVVGAFAGGAGGYVGAPEELVAVDVTA